MTAAAFAVAAEPTTVDAFLGGRLQAVQPAAGHHRAGLEAVFLGAALGPGFAGTVVDLGAGAGVAGLAVAARCAKASVVLVERDPTAVACARAALALAANRAFADRVSVVAADVAWPEARREAAGLKRASAEAVIMNPPFNPAGGDPSPRSALAAAHVLGEGGLAPWLRTAASVLRPGGRLAVVFRADGLDPVLAACRDRFGALDVLPIAPHAGAPARRVLVGGVKGGRGPLRLLSPLVLHAADRDGWTAEAAAVLSGARSLGEVHPSWPR